MIKSNSILPSLSKCRKINEIFSTAGDRAFFALFAAAVSIAIATLRDYGISYDEAIHNIWYGEAIWRFFGSLGKNMDAVATPDNIYGGLFDALAEALVRLRLLTTVNSRHLANVCAGLAGVWGCRSTARLLGGAWAGFWAALLLLTTAPYYGHMFINAKDIPFAAGVIWSIYFLLRWGSAFPDVPKRLRLALALALGFAMGVRVGGIVLLGYTLLIAALDTAAWKWAGHTLFSTAARARRWCVMLIPVFIGAYALMIAAWPAALLYPLDIPLRGLRMFSHFSRTIAVVFQGNLLPAAKLPWTYIPVMLAAILPEAFFLLALGAIAWAPGAAWRAYRAGRTERTLIIGLLATAAIFPLLWASFTRAALYDNLRHFLFVLPPAAALIAIAWTELLRNLPRRVAAAAVLVLAILLSAQAARMAALHPYEYVFFSVFGGGMPGGGRRFDSEYWLTSYREATLDMVAHARSVAATQGKAFEDCRFTVLVTGNEVPVKVVAPPNFIVIGPDKWGVLRDQSADYFLSTTRWGLDSQRANWPIVAQVARLGMRFAVVRARPDIAPTAPGR